MDIYLLREGKEFGPFSEETTESFLSEGRIVPEDLAWTPGLPAWSPLEQVLHGPVAEVEAAAEDAPILAPAESIGEPASAKQQAFLSYLGVPFSPESTREHAAILVNEAMENPRLSGRIAQWNEERLLLHPELFAEEAQARREDRANRFWAVCESEGAEFFKGLTREHCQTLITYLDVRFPHWDAHESAAAIDYFFPAVAEKFPAVVRRAWRGKLHYPGAVRPPGGSAPRAASVRLQPGPAVGVAPVRAIIRGVVAGLALLLLLYVGGQFFVSEPGESAPAPVPVPVEQTAPGPAPQLARKELVEAIPPPPSPEPSPAPAESPAAEMSDAATPADTASATTGTPRTHVVLVKPFLVNLPPYGSAKLNAGTMLKIAAQNAREVTAIYNAQSITIPLEYTDLPAAPAR